MHPDDVVGLEQRSELASEECVDPEVLLEFAAIVPVEAQQIVADRPERCIAEAVVIEVVALVVQVDSRVIDRALFLDLRVPWLAGSGIAVPAEPQAAVFLERRQNADGQAAGSTLARPRTGDAIRNCD